MKYRLVNAPIKEDYARNLLKCRGVVDYDYFINVDVLGVEKTSDLIVDIIKNKY